MRRVITNEGVHILLENEEEVQCVEEIEKAINAQLDTVEPVNVEACPATVFLEDCISAVEEVTAINHCGIFETRKEKNNG